jgi:hypothetical protein
MYHIRILSFIFIAFLLVIVAQRTMIKSDTKIVTQSPTPTQKLFPSPTVTPIVLSTPVPPTNTPLPPTTAPVSSPTGSWVYPGASGDGTTMQSSVDAETVTDWYKSQIDAAGMNAKTTVRTKTNGVINNVVAGANSHEKVKVEIKQSPGTQTMIYVTRTTY